MSQTKCQKIYEDMMVTLDIRGQVFKLEVSTLEKIHFETKLGKLVKKHLESGATESIYLNRDPYIFSHILDFYVTETLHMPKNVCAARFKDELEFWEICEQSFCSGCHKRYREELEEMHDLQQLVEKWSEYMPESQLVDQSRDEHLVPIRGKIQQRIWKFLEHPGESRCSIVYVVFILMANILSVAFLSLATIPDLRHVNIGINQGIRNVFPGPHNQNDSLKNMNHTMTTPNLDDYTSVLEYLRKTQAYNTLFLIDAVCMVMLTLDLILRSLVSPLKCRFFLQPINILGVLSLLPIWIGVVMSIIMTYIEPSEILTETVQKIAVMEVFRVLYLLRIANYYQPMRVILLALRESRREMTLLVIVLLTGALIYGHMIFAVEIRRASFWTIPTGIYWAVITMTTVGYGDIYPESVIGKTVGAICAITGILLIALPVPVIANNFVKFYHVSKFTKYKPKKTTNASSCVPHVKEAFK